jgi:hypothetical protein
LSDELEEIYYLKMFEPQNIVEIVECNTTEDCYKVLYRYMKRYGVNNVRGLKYQQIELELSDILELQQKLGYKRIFKDAIYKENETFNENYE